jgi:hypothetical protein
MGNIPELQEIVDYIGEDKIRMKVRDVFGLPME